jgi:hypothetical protein
MTVDLYLHCTFKLFDTSTALIWDLDPHGNDTLLSLEVLCEVDVASLKLS